MPTFRPTLIIGLGGSGTFVVRRLKKRLQRVIEGEIPQAIQLLAIDTDGQRSVPTLDELGKSEFLRIDDFAADGVVSSAKLPSFPEIASWWKFKQLSPGFVSDGAKQRPPVGRLAFFVKFEKFHKHLSNAVQRMFQMSGSGYPTTTEKKVDIHIVGSSCGGTGAGIFFDTALLAQHLINTSGRTPIAHANVFLPSCFQDSVGNLDSLHANASIFLRALEGAQRSGFPQIAYRTLTASGVDGHLFERVFLVSGRNAEGFGFPDLQHIYEKVALQLDLRILSAAAKDVESFAVNHPTEFNRRPQGRMSCYSSFGANQLGGTPEITRYELLPRLVEGALKALGSSSADSPQLNSLTSHKVFSQIQSVLENETAALELAPGYSTEVKITRAHSDAKSAIRGLADKLDRIVLACEVDWLDGLGELTKQIEEELSERLTQGAGGVSTAFDYLSSCATEIGSMLTLIEQVRQRPVEGPESIVSKVDGYFAGIGNKSKDVLERHGLPYLKEQTVLRIRKRIADRVLPELQSLAQYLEKRRLGLKSFPETASAINKAVAEYSKTQLALYLEKIGTAANVVDKDRISKEFRSRANEIIAQFLADCSRRGLLEKLLSSASNNDIGTTWMTAFTQAADEFISRVFSPGDTITPDWASKAADSIMKCQPMVPLVNDLSQQTSYPRVAVARVYQKESVSQALALLGGEFDVELVESTEPGLLEVSSMILNFPLYALQELQQIEDGYKNWKLKKAELAENRWPLRGPGALYKRLRQIELLPLTPQRQALARILAFHPATGIPIAVERASTYYCNGAEIDSADDSTWYTKRRDLNEELINSGQAEALIENLHSTDKSVIRSHFEQLIKIWSRKVEESELKPLEEDDWDSYLGLLRLELDEAREYLSKIPE